MEAIKRFYQRAFAPTSIASLVYFRILFGAIMIWEVYRYFSKGWIPKYYMKPTYYFTYYGFHWVQPLPGNWMYVIWGFLGLFSFFIMLGYFYRISIISFFILFSYIFLLAKSHYLNHFYFIILVSGIMMFLSPHKQFSIDQRRGAIKESFYTENWQIWLLRFQMGCVYFYGGIAKLDVDWIFGVPLNRWLNKHSSIPYIGNFLANDFTALGLSWFGLLLDLLVVPALLYKKTRLWGFLALCGFHISNHFLFNIGIFPWFSLGMTLLFFSTDLPIRVIERFMEIKINWPRVSQLAPRSLNTGQKRIGFFITLFVLYNCLMPLRHHLYKGDVHWTELGHTYSWRMKLRSKRSHETVFYFRDMDTGVTWKEKPSKRLRKKQRRNLGGNPEMLLQYAQYLKKIYENKGHKNLRIRIKSYAAVNFRDEQRIIIKKFNMENEKDCVFCNPEWLNHLNDKNKRSFSKSKEIFLTNMSRN